VEVTVAALELSSTRHGDRTVVAIKGELDIVSRTQFTAHLDRVIRGRYRRLEMDKKEQV